MHSKSQEPRAGRIKNKAVDETGQRATHMKQSQLATCRVAYP